jgi:subtilisin family serine protease
VLPCTGVGDISLLVAGFDWVTANHAPRSVANLSVSADPNATVDQAVQKSIDAGVTYVIGASNDNADACTKSPARVKSAITVGSTRFDDARSESSNFGNCVNLFAAGESILSAGLNGGTARKTGTSMASPHPAGAAALALSAHPDFRPQQVADHLVNNATPDVVGNAGNGSPNKLLYVADTR